ncbi:probable E3 ubiquitin-protein ligase RHY1A [Aristolochia californica]|uniref:probable E3 ubiquitin-protein ligase RHY1A n=1 Tax=Aristolochia californica TaxID=171875 RepID=UPI0035D9C19E
MTSASELFHSRRSRVGRNVGSELASALDRNLHLHSSHRHHGDYHHQRRIRPEDDPDPLRRPRLHSRHLCHRVSQTERESIRMGLGPTEPATDNFGNLETSSNRANNPRLTMNNRLPGAVLQARARLLERLRGLTANREINTVSGFPWHEFAMNDDPRVVDGETIVWERETPREALSSAPYIANSVFQEEQSLDQTHLNQKKPPGLSRAAISALPREVFDIAQVDGLAEECCICLERFWEGDGLICLPCGHRFHPLCVDPWVRACGDCPYCRTAIVVNCGASNAKT